MIINAILPIFLLIIFGYILKKSPLVDDAFWNGAEQLTYYIFFPALLISKMSVAQLDGINLVAIATICFSGLLFITVLSYVLKYICKISDFSFGAFYQGNIRFNTYIGLALVSNLFEPRATAIAIIIAAVLIPAVNICSVMVLQLHQADESGKAPKTASQQFIQSVYKLLKNPLIISCLTGIAINSLNITIPKPLYDSISIVGSLALPMGLMAVGAALVLHNIQQVLTPILLSSGLKLLALPSIGFYLAGFFELAVLTKHVLVIFLALPTATAGYVLTKNMKSDYQLMARIITFETLFSGITLLAVLSFLEI